MTTITTHEAKTHLSRYLTEVASGKEFIIARGKKAVAKLVPIQARTRPKVGEHISPIIEVPETALAALSEEELKIWGL